MKTDVYNQKGEKVSTLELPKEVFDVPFESNTVHQALTTQLANSRVVRASTKTRREVSGGGKKPWKQKHTGRARHGSIRSPIWVGGGITFGPSTARTFEKKINKKMKRKALCMVLSAKARDHELIILDALSIPEPKTKYVAEVLAAFSKREEEGVLKKDSTKKKKKQTGAPKKRFRFPRTLIVLSEKQGDVIRANRNIPYSKALRADSLNVVDLLSYKYVLMPKNTVEQIKNVYAVNK